MTRIEPPAPPYLGPARNAGPGTNKPIDRIVIHATVSPCERGGARNIARYFKTTTRDASAHYVVDPSDTVQVVFDSVVAYHAPPNQHSLGVELCDPMTGPGKRWRDADHEAMLKRAAELVAQLCLAYDIPVLKVSGKQMRDGARGICGHADVRDGWGQTTHYDPGEEFPWKYFMRLVRTAVAGLVDSTPTPPVPAPATKPKKPNRITRARALLTAAFKAKSAGPGRKRRIKAALDRLPKR